MKANCKALKLSIFISSVFLFLIIVSTIVVLNNECKFYEILLNIFIGVFGSGCVTLLLAIPSYNVSKRLLLEKYWQETKRLIEKFSDIQFLFNEYNEKTVVSYLNELKSRKWKEEYNKIGKDKIVLEDEKYKEKLIEEFSNKNLNLQKEVSKEVFHQYASECIDKYIEKIRANCKKIYNQYINISKESTIELSFMLGEMQFFSGKKPLIKIYNNTYKPLYDTLNIIQEESYHFQLFLNGEGNEAVVLEKLLMIQKEIFEVEIKETDDDRSYIINNKFLNKMLINLETFRADMYGIKPEYPELHPIQCRTYKKR